MKYESELLRLVKIGEQLANTDENREIKKMLHVNPAFHDFMIQLDILQKSLSFDKNVEARFILNFMLQICKDNTKLNNKVIEYAKKYGI